MNTVRVYVFKGFTTEPTAIMGSLVKSLEFGADGVVLNICSTRDKIPVVCPDTPDLRTPAPTILESELGGGLIGLEKVLSGIATEVLLWVREPQILDLVAKTVGELHAEGRTYMVVDDLLQARVVRNTHKSVRTVVRISNPFPNVAIISREGVYGIALPATVIRPRLVKECASRGIQVYAWLVNDVSQAVRVLRYGVQLFITSRPTLKKELERYVGELTH